MAALAVAAWLWFPAWVAVGLTGATLFCLNFFRDPERPPPPDAADGILSPADGKVVAVTPHDDPFLDEPGQRISIFMSVFDVHVNRAPVTGTVGRVTYHPGRFINAMAADASECNEQTRITLHHERGRLTVTQVAGLIARRIICYCYADGPMVQGERIGLIRFGSRLDVVIPARCRVRVRVGERVAAGRSILADWS